MVEEKKYYHVWKKGTPVEKSLLIESLGNSYHSFFVSEDYLKNKIKFKLNNNNPLVDESYNVSPISNKRAFKKFQDYKRGRNLPDWI